MFAMETHEADRLAFDTATAVASELEAEIACDVAHINAATARMLDRLADFDRLGRWATGGYLSCAHWLSVHCGVTPGAAAEQVSVAAKLAHLPRIRAEFLSGRLGYTQVRTLVRVATKDNEDTLVDIALCAPPDQVQKLVRSYATAGEAADTGTEEVRRDRHRLSWMWDDTGSLCLRGRIEPAGGAVVVAALAAARDALAAGAPDQDEPPRAADALVAVAEASLEVTAGTTAAAERYQVTVVTDHAVLSGDDAGGPGLSPATARRIACDCTTVEVAVDPNGVPVAIGAKTRRIPARLRRALKVRDGGCLWPGCHRDRFVDAHHVTPWPAGPTTLTNLGSLCRYHHRRVHEGGFTMDLGPDGSATFFCPDGTRVPGAPAPPQIDGDLAARNSALGVVVDADTCRPDWYGDVMDFDIAVCALLRSDGAYP